MTTPEESTEPKGTPAPVVEESNKVSSPEEGQKSVAVSEENDQPSQSQDQTMVSKEEDSEKVVTEEEDNQKVPPQEEDNLKVAPQEEDDQKAVPEEDDDKMESEEEKNEEVVSQEDNNEVASQEEENNQKSVPEDGGNKQTPVSEEQNTHTSVPDEQNNEGLPSHEENSQVSVGQEEGSSQRLSPQHELNLMDVPQQENSEMVTEEVHTEMPAPQQESSEITVPQEEDNEMVTDDEHSEMAVPQEENNEIVTNEEHSEMPEPPQVSSQVLVPEEGNNEMVVTEEEKNEVVVPQEENIEMVVTEVEKSEEVVVPQEENYEIVVTEEEKSEIAVPQEENDEMVTDEERNEMEEPPQESIQVLVPEEGNNEMLVTEEEKNEAVLSQGENSEMVVTEVEKREEVAVPQEENNEIVVAEEGKSEVVVSQEENSEMVVTESENTEKEVLQQENSQILAPEEVNVIELAPPQEANTQLVVPQEENTQPLESHVDDNPQIDNQMMHEDSGTQMILSDEDNNSQIMMSHDELMGVSHEENHHPVLMSHEENIDNKMIDGNHHHMGDQLTVMEEDNHNNNQLIIPHHDDDENNNQLILAHDDENGDLVTPDSRPNKRRRKKSVVWEHFTIETVGDGCRRASCKQCKQSFAYSTGSKVAGTSHLKRHIAKGTCLALLRSHGHPQMLTYNTPGGATSEPPPKRRYRSPNSSSYFPFDSDRCRHEIAKMIIMHDYPLHMVEHAGFMTFVSNLQPRFGMVSFNTVQGDCVATYLREKQNVMKFIEGLPGRVALTLDMWTSCESLGYVYITGHFIDSDWKPQKRMLNVEMEPYPDSDVALSHAVACCLSDWSLEGKLFSVTFNHPVGEAGLESLQSLLCIKNTRILNGQLVRGNCSSHTLTSMAKELMSACQDLVSKIRDSVKYVKTLESHEEKFLELKQQLQVPTDKNLRLDDQTQWNTTYEMLLAACELKEVFLCLDTSDPHYKEAPTMLEWKQVETICSILKNLVDAANLLSSSTGPIAITFFQEAWRIHSELSKLAAIEDPFINNFIKGLQDKIEKYIKDCSLVLAVAVVMDPRFKMKLVEFTFSKIYGDDAPTYVNIVADGVQELYKEYVVLPLPLTPTYEENADPNLRNDENQHGPAMDTGLADFDLYIMESRSHQAKSELDLYLGDSLLPRLPDFDVLEWWRQNKMKYPTLSKMARDVLSIPVSTASAENVFDTVLPREMDRYRSSLRPETVEALVCAKDWLCHAAATAAASGDGGGMSDGVVKMEL